jgi:hypothetical protein
MKTTTTRRARITFVFAGIALLLTIGGFVGKRAQGQPMELYERRIISGNIDEVWRIATDVNRWPEWDPHEEAGEIYGPFEEGTRAYSKPRGGPGANWTLTEVTENQSWSLINPMRIGTLEVENRYTSLPDGQVLCEKTMQVSGWVLVALFKLHFEAATRKDMQATWGALEERLARQEDSNVGLASEAGVN